MIHRFWSRGGNHARGARSCSPEARRQYAAATPGPGHAGRTVEAIASGGATGPSDEAMHTYELGAGALLHVAPRHAVPVVAARAAFAGGLLAETAESSGISWSVLVCTCEGPAEEEVEGCWST